MTTKSASFTTVEVLRALQQSIYSLGVNKVIAYLKWLSSIDANNPDEVTRVIIDSVCDKYKIDSKELLGSQRHDGKNQKALCIIVLLLKKHVMMSQTEIAHILNRHKSLISRYLGRMKTLNIELFKEDREMFNYYKEIDKSIDFLFTPKNKEWSQKEGEDPEKQPM